MDGMLVDAFDRTIDYLRVSVTEACDYHCLYCGGGKTTTLLPLSQLLHLVSTFSSCGIRHVRVTGGEPLLREGVVPFIRDVGALKGIETVTLTTNGSHLGAWAHELGSIPITGVNVSLDATDRALFAHLSGGGDVETVIRGIDAALEAGIPVKLNCVPLATVWKEQAAQLFAFASSRGIPLRFIELMPFGSAASLQAVDVEVIASFLEESHAKAEVYGAAFGDGPAEYRYYDGVAIGFIGAVSHRFCGNCNRIRLLSDGSLKLCLDQAPTLNLAALIREGDDVLKTAIRTVIREKQEHHHFGEAAGVRPSLGLIGG